METCEDCGCRVYSLGCVNCNEADYIEVEFAQELSEIRAKGDYPLPPPPAGAGEEE